MKFTRDGIQTDTLQAIYSELEAEYKRIYGIENDITQDQPDGQKIGIEAKAKDDIQQLAVAIYNSLDPDLADGNSIYKLLKLTGITPRPATRSTWDLEVESSRAATLPSGYTIKDDLDQEWQLLNDTPVTVGIQTLTFTASDFGAVEGVASAEITQVTPEPYIVEILAPTDAVVGVEAETIQQLRIRRNRSLQKPALSLVGAIFANVGNVAGVTDVAVYENETDATDADGIPPHGIWVIVEGGDVNDIAEAIAKQKTGGSPLKGSVTGTFTQTLTRPNGVSFTQTITKRFDRPDYTDIFITLDAKLIDSSNSLDTALIKQELAKAVYYIGENIKASTLYQFGYIAGRVFTLSNLRISKDNITFTDDILIANKDEKFRINIDNITITDIT